MYNNKKYVVILEVEGGSDKGKDGHRKDTFPILEEVKEQGFEGEVIFFSHEKKDEIFEYILQKAGGVIGRINPGNLENIDEYFSFLNEISKHNILVNTHPDVMVNLSFKDILVKLKDCSFSHSDSYFYHTYEEFCEAFPKILQKEKKRVLKQNYGSTGEWVFLVDLEDSGKIQVVEAVNNEKMFFENIDELLLAFKKYFEVENENATYFAGKTGFVDVKYLPRISQWEVRVVLTGNTPALVVHKKPQEWAFSATLFSGAKYKSDRADDPKWREVIEVVEKNLPKVQKYISGQEFPLIWTLDFILDYDEQGKDIYILSEINCSCVGITTDLHLAKNIASELVKIFER